MTDFFLIASAAFGLIIGSFLNCLVWRLYTSESLGGRSHCCDCGKQVRWYDNIPLLSFILLRGRCRDCRIAISWQYPVVEAATALLFAAAAWRLTLIFGAVDSWGFEAALTLVRDWIFIASLIAVFVTDIRWYVIFDQVTLPASAVLLVLNLMLGVSWQSLLLSGTIGIGFFLLQFLVSRGRWIGGGDIRLGLLLGVSLGWPLIIPGIFIAYFIGSFVGVGLLIAAKKKWQSRLPLGTFLSVSAIVTLFYGEQIVDWYLRVINVR